MQINNMREALQHALKIYRVIFPIAVLFFFVVGIVLLLVVPEMVTFVGYILIGMGVLMGLIFYAMYAIVRAKVNKLLAQEQQDKQNTQYNMQF